MIGIIDYKTGNLKSVQNALYRVGAEYIISSDIERLSNCSHLIMPGVGSAGWAMENLKECRLEEWIPGIKIPVLGICLGMQLMCSYSEEDETRCLGIFSNRVTKMRGEGKVPHVGWNSIYDLKGELYNNLPEDSYLYFVHSYSADINDNTISRCSYNGEFSASIQSGNFIGCQFHPEKSGDTGEIILKNFLKMQI